MRPDARLLCLCDLLPFVPDGARTWVGLDPFFAGPRPPGSMLDLSEPGRRYGWLSRLDMGLWAAHALGWTGIPIQVASDRFVTPATPMHLKSVLLCLTSESERMRSISDHVLDLDLSGLDEDLAGRAALAEVLRHPEFLRFDVAS